MKPGWQTSEAWLTGIVGWLMHDVIAETSDWRVQAAAALGAAIATAVYIWSRAKVKTSPAVVGESKVGEATVG